MRRLVAKSPNLVLIPLLLAIAVPGSSIEESEKADEPVEYGGWIRAGEKSRLAPDVISRSGAAPGELATFGPAEKVRALLTYNDTLWIGTEGGLFAYSLVEDTLVSLGGAVSTSIWSIMADDAGSVWIGGEEGLSVRGEGGWKHYTEGSNPFFLGVRDVAQGEGKVWVGSFGRGCAYISDDTLTVFSRSDSLLDDRVLSVVEENPHTVLFGTSSGLCRADTLRWESMRYGRGIPLGSIEDMIFDEEGSLFLAVTRRGVSIYKLGRVRRYGPQQGLAGWGIHSLSLDQEGRVWAAGDGGLSIFEGSGWTPYRVPGLPLGRYRFLSIHHDVEGNCYLGTDEGVVLILARDRTREIKLPQIFPEGRVARIRMIGGELWLLAEGNIYKLGETMVEIASPAEWGRGGLLDITGTGGKDLWAASRFGILHFDGRSWEVYDRRQGLPTEYFNRSARDAEGHLWFGTIDSGILEFSGRGWVHYTEKNGLPDNRIVDLVVDGYGIPWVVTGDGNVARFNGDSWEKVILPGREVPGSSELTSRDSLFLTVPEIRFLKEPGLEEGASGTGRVTCIGLDQGGNCIVCTPDLLFRLTEEGWHVIDAPPSAVGSKPTAVAGAGRGGILLGTSGRGAFITHRGDWRWIGDRAGAKYHVLSVCEDPNGTIWIGTKSHGLKRFVPASQ